MIQFKPLYEIGDNVYHATPDGDKGIILDVTYSVRSRQVTYKVSYGRRSDDEILCFQEELSLNKIF